MNIERSFTVNYLFATFMKHSTGTFNNCYFLMFQENSFECLKNVYIEHYV